MQKHVPDRTNPSGIMSNQSTQQSYSPNTMSPEDPLREMATQQALAPDILADPSCDIPLDALSRLLEQSDAQIMAYEPELRKKFGKALLASPLYAPVEQSGTNPDGSHDVSLQAAIMEDIPHVLIFSSLDNLMLFCEPGTNFVEVTGLDIITQIQNHFAILNAGTNGRAFTPKDLSEVLHHHEQNPSLDPVAPVSGTKPMAAQQPQEFAPQLQQPLRQQGQQQRQHQGQYQPNNPQQSVASRPVASPSDTQYVPPPMVQR